MEMFNFASSLKQTIIINTIRKHPLLITILIWITLYDFIISNYISTTHLTIYLLFWNYTINYKSGQIEYCKFEIYLMMIQNKYNNKKEKGEGEMTILMDKTRKWKVGN